ncbi:MAG: acylphosphatase, partial [Acidiferrobacterales bacterium]
MVLCRRYRVSGRVQGVFFRASARDRAIGIGVTGWVRNTSEGDVELIACGEENQFTLLESWFPKGPAH